MNRLWEPIPHRGILSQPRHMGEGLGPAPKDVTDFEDPPMEGLTLPEEQKVDGIGVSEGRGEGEGEGTGIDM